MATSINFEIQSERRAKAGPAVFALTGPKPPLQSLTTRIWLRQNQKPSN